MTAIRNRRRTRGLDARFEAQKIAFSPVVFQCVRLLWTSGILERLSRREDGLTISEVVAEGDWSEYAVTVLLESGLSARVVAQEGERFCVTQVGDYILHDPMTQVNFEFNHHCCYRGMYHLETSLRRGIPAGLAEWGPWSSIYEGLSHLPDDVKESWLAFDHMYSDSAFSDALPIVFGYGPSRILDVGGNTGRWAMRCLSYDPNVQVTIADLPGQLKLAGEAVSSAGMASRFFGCPVDVLDSSQSLPTGHDLVWMSQFLCCFQESDIVDILSRLRRVMTDASHLCILDTFPDRQRHEVAAYCITNTSPYFAALANGNSRMYSSQTIARCIAAAGLTLETERDGLGLSHTLMICRK